MIKYASEVLIPQGAIVFVNDEFHTTRAPYLIISNDDYAYGTEYITMKISSKFKGTIDKTAAIPVCINGKTSFINPYCIQGLSSSEVSPSCISMFINHDLLTLCLHALNSRFGLYDRYQLACERERYVQYYNSFGYPLYDESQLTKIIDSMETSCSEINKGTLTLPYHIKSWTNEQLIGFMDDYDMVISQGMDLEEFMTIYGINSVSAKYSKVKSVKKEYDARQLSKIACNKITNIRA